MHQIGFWWMLSLAFPPTVGPVTEVAYQLNVEKLAPVEVPSVTPQLAIEFQDRVWTAPGVEQSDSPMGEPEKFDFSAPYKVHIVQEGMTEGPRWLDDVAWPRTRYLFRPYYAFDSPQVYGGITLQR